MSRRLPPLNQLRAFEAAARLGSFKAAAEELHVTHAAISHQIKALEEFLGRPLFRRLTRKVELTDEARDLAAPLSRAFDRMAEATRNFTTAGATRPLRITSAPFYGNRVVIPALPTLLSEHPDLQVEISLDYSYIDLDAKQFDAGIRYGKGDWPGLDAIHIHNDVIAPVGAPAFLEGRELPLKLDEISALPLAADRMSLDQWSRWFEAAGGEMPSSVRIWEFDNRAMVQDFALAGNGLVLTDLRITYGELAQGKLIRLHRTVLEMPNSMWLVYPESETPDPRIGLFADWLRATTAAMDLEIGAP